MIIYFSATGNCKHVAHRIAEQLHTNAISISECDSNIELIDDEIFGIVSPTYYAGLPTIVNEFLEKLSFSGLVPKYSFFVGTYGTSSGQTGYFTQQLLDKKITLNAKYSVKMPDTWTPTFDLSDPDKVAKKNQKAEIQIDNVIQHIKSYDCGDYMKAKMPKLFAKKVYSTYDKARETAHFSVKDNCISCGLCAKKCPIQAIRMEDGEPVWTKAKCVMCLGCLHRCPKFSIQYDNKTENHGQYIHP